jgi:poly-gamma-glutamate synthesis protein (capsule biosynthesis protein)
MTNGKKEEITLSFVGDVSLADNWYIMPEYDKRNKKVYGILSEEVVQIMTSSDIMVANNEFTISNRGSKMPNKYYTFRGKPERLNIYKEMGVNLVTLANNHIYDYGKTAFNDAIDALNEYDIPYIGAGKNIEEAKEPFYYIINGYKIGFVNATRAEKYILTPEATETSGGVLRCYDPTTFLKVIEETKKNSDFVIALVHWGKEDSSELEQVQLDTSKKYIEAGADLIVGTHAHTLQGIDFYNNKAIVYNIGDFIFNHETKDTGIFQLKIDNDGNFKYYFLPCKQKDKYTSLLTDVEMTRVLNKMRNLSPNITITETGEFYQNNTN